MADPFITFRMGSGAGPERLAGLVAVVVGHSLALVGRSPAWVDRSLALASHIPAWAVHHNLVAAVRQVASLVAFRTAEAVHSLALAVLAVLAAALVLRTRTSFAVVQAVRAVQAARVVQLVADLHIRVGR